MKQTNHLLDDFLHHKVEEANFSMKEEYWQKMSVLLDEEDKKRKRPFFWRWLSVLGILLVVGVGTYLFPKLSNKEKQAATMHQTLPTDKENTLPSVKQDVPETDQQDHKQESSSNQSLHQNNTPTLPNNNISNKTITDTSSTITTHSNTDQIEKNTNESTGDLHKQEPKNNVEQTLSRKEQRKEQRKVRKEIRLKKHDVKQLPQTQVSVPPTLSKNEKTTSSKKDVAMIQKQASVPNKTKKTLAIGSTPKRNKTTLVDNKQNEGINKDGNIAKSTTTTVPVKGRQMTPIDTTHSTKRHPIDQSIYNPRYIGALADYIPERLDSVTIIRYQPAIATTPVEQKIETAISKLTPSKKYPFEFMLLVGMNMNKGLKGNVSNPVSWALSPYLGVGIDKQFTSKITLSSHIGFTYFNGLNSQINITSHQYTFGLDSSTFTVAHKKLLQLYLPFSVYYELFKNHFIMASLGASYTFNVSSKVTQTSMSSNSGYPPTTTKLATSSSSTQSGYSNGFNQFDIFAQLGYSYRLAQKILLQCSIQQGFFDITKNSYFNNSVNNTQTRISLGLKYNFKRN